MTAIFQNQRWLFPVSVNISIFLETTIVWAPRIFTYWGHGGNKYHMYTQSNEFGDVGNINSLRLQSKPKKIVTKGIKNYVGISGKFPNHWQPNYFLNKKLRVTWPEAPAIYSSISHHEQKTQPFLGEDSLVLAVFSRCTHKPCCKAHRSWQHF